MKQKLNILSKIANNEKVADALVYVGIFGSVAFQALAIGASYLRGLKKGVDTRDDYYYEQELKEYTDGRE